MHSKDKLDGPEAGACVEKGNHLVPRGGAVAVAAVDLQTPIAVGLEKVVRRLAFVHHRERVLHGVM